MKNIVIFDEFHEIDLKPADLLKRYAQLTEKDVKALLIKTGGLKSCLCPGCQSKKIASSFKKFGLRYVECANCRTLYISPRPNDKKLNQYYNSSKSRAYWQDVFSKATIKKRKEKIIKPRFQWITDSTSEYLPQAQVFADINTNQYGYIEEMAGSQLFKRKILINPSLKLASTDVISGINILNSAWWDTNLKEEIDVISLFEVIDRTSDINLLLEKLKTILKKSGLLHITTILISGFDLLTLWDKAENLFPPDRLNVFSVEGLRAVLDRHGFECLEFSTPGILDLGIVTSAIKQNPKLKLSKFTDYLLQKRDDNVKRAFQEFLQANLLSSYGRIVARKK